MLGKLMKYEFRATARTFLPLFAALVAVSLVNRILDALGMETPVTIGIVVTIVLIAAIFVIAFIITLQRFSRSLLQNEGYLMMTLPVKTESLILSKLFVSTIWYVASAVIVLIAIVLLPITGVTWSDVARFFRQVFSDVSAQEVLILIEGIVTVIVNLFASTLLIYACLALGMLVNSRRGLFSFGAFIVITTALQIIGSIAVSVFYFTGMWKSFTNWSNLAMTHLTILGTALIALAGCVIFFLATRHMLKNRLNLQ